METLDCTVFGLIVADLIAKPMDLRNPPAPGGLHPVHSITLTSGGNVCNTGVAMAKLGMRTAAAGRVGADALGQAVLQMLKDAGLDVSAVEASDLAQTSATVVAVEPGGERCFFHTPGATRLLDATAFERCFDLFARSRMLQIGYFGLLPALTEVLPGLLGKLRSRAPRLKIALDTVNPPDAWERLAPILPLIDIFCPSRAEAAALSGLSEPEKMAWFFRKHMPAGALVGIKLDAQGCLLDDGIQAIRTACYPVTVADTTGAGDTWFAGLMCGLLRGLDLATCAKLANRVAGDCCQAIGASAGLRDFAATISRL